MNRLKLFFALAIIGASGAASAAPLTWNYTGTGTCSQGCTGAVNISGTLSGDPANFGSASILSALDGISYLWQLTGAIVETYSGTVSTGSYTLNSSGQIVNGTMTFGDLGQLEFLDVGSSTWSFIDKRIVAVIFTRTERAASGTGSYSVVPEPGSLALLGFGLAALGLVRRRRAQP